MQQAGQGVGQGGQGRAGRGGAGPGPAVEGLQRRPPTEVGGLGLDYYRDPFPHSLLRTRQLKHSKFRVSGLGLRSHFCEAFAYGHTH